MLDLKSHGQASDVPRRTQTRLEQPGRDRRTDCTLVFLDSRFRGNDIEGAGMTKTSEKPSNVILRLACPRPRSGGRGIHENWLGVPLGNTPFNLDFVCF